MTTLNFNAQQYEPKYSGGGGLPVNADGSPAKYKVIICGDEQKPTAKGDGGYLALELQCIEGPHAGTKQTDNLNLWNPSPKAVEIANKQLSAYCHAVGVFIVQDTAQLHNRPFVVEVRKQKNNPEYTEISGVFDINGNAPGSAPVQQQQAPAPAPAPQVAPTQPPAQGWGGAPAAEPQAQAQQPPAQGWTAPAPAPTPAGGGGWTPPAGGAPSPTNPWANR